MNSSFELFVKNPKSNSPFPLLVLDCNNHISIPPRQRFQEMHWHNDLQLIFVLSGSIKVNTLQDSYIIDENEAIFINKHVLHQVVDISNSHYRSYIFPENLILFHNLTEINDSINSILNNRNINAYPIINAEILSIVKKLDQCYFGVNDKYKYYHLCSLLSQIMYELISIDSFHESKNNTQDIHVEECLCFIHSRYAENITLEEIASYANISVGYCGRLFQKMLSTTPINYLINYRIKKSLELLEQQELSITQIALEVGFNSSSHYIASFKKKMNMTPKQYQKSYLE